MANNISAAVEVDIADENVDENEDDEKVQMKRALDAKYGTRPEGIELVWVETKGEGEWVPK